MGFQDSSWNIRMSSLVIPAASVFDISSEKQTKNGENSTHVTAFWQSETQSCTSLCFVERKRRIIPRMYPRVGVWGSDGGQSARSRDRADTSLAATCATLWQRHVTYFITAVARNSRLNAISDRAEHAPVSRPLYRPDTGT